MDHSEIKQAVRKHKLALWQKLLVPVIRSYCRQSLTTAKLFESMKDAGFPETEIGLLNLRWGTIHNNFQVKDNPMLSAEECAEKLGITVEEVHTRENFAVWKVFSYLTEGMTWEQEGRAKRNWFVAFITAIARPLIRNFRCTTLGRALAEQKYDRRLSYEETLILTRRWTVYSASTDPKGNKCNKTKMYSLPKLNHDLLHLNNWYRWTKRSKHHYPISIGVVEELELKAIRLLVQRWLSKRPLVRPVWSWGEGAITFNCMIDGSYTRFIDYKYCCKCMSLIKFNWVWTENIGEKEVVVCFKLLKSGIIEDIRIVESSGDKDLDQSAYDAIEWSSPLQPFPTDAPPELEVEFVFGQFLLDIDPAFWTQAY